MIERAARSFLLTIVHGLGQVANIPLQPPRETIMQKRPFPVIALISSSLLLASAAQAAETGTDSSLPSYQQALERVSGRAC